MPPLLLVGLTLLLPLLLGVLLGVLRVFSDPDAAVGVLNKVALYVGFPLLIVVGMTDRDFTLPSEVGFWLVIPGVGLLTVGVLALAGLMVPRLREGLGALVLTSVWGNVAYIGLPVVTGVFGESILGLASLAITLHVLVSMLLGPTLLIAWSGVGAAGALRRAVVAVAKQPLTWSPVVGLAMRLLPAPVLDVAVPVLRPVAGMTGPVALLLIGLFLHTHRRRLKPDPGALFHVGAKLVLVPLLTAAVAWPLHQLGWLTAEQGTLLFVLAAMPTAISTFAFAVEFESEVERVAIAVVVSTAMAVVWIPLVVTLVG